MKQLYFLLDPTSDPSEIMDAIDMTQEEAAAANMEHLMGDSDWRWVDTPTWQDRIRSANELLGQLA